MIVLSQSRYPQSDFQEFELPDQYLPKKKEKATDSEQNGEREEQGEEGDEGDEGDDKEFTDSVYGYGEDPYIFGDKPADTLVDTFSEYESTRVRQCGAGRSRTLCGPSEIGRS